METISKYALFKEITWQASFYASLSHPESTIFMLYAERKIPLPIPIVDMDHGLRAQFALKMGLPSDLLSGVVFYCSSY
jgi:hypothetical protein